MPSNFSFLLPPEQLVLQLSMQHSSPPPKKRARIISPVDDDLQEVVHMAQAPPLELVLERLDSRPISPPPIIIPQPSLVYKKAIVAAAARGRDIRAPGMAVHLVKILAENAPGVDISEFLVDPRIALPPSGKFLPAYNILYGLITYCSATLSTTLAAQ